MFGTYGQHLRLLPQHYSSIRPTRPCLALRPPPPGRPTPARQRKAAQIQSLFGWGKKAAIEPGDIIYDGRVTVAKLQVGLLGSAQQIRQKLERVAARADTDSPGGLHHILQEAVLVLLCNPGYCLYGYAEGVNMGSAGQAEVRFNRYSLEERSKSERETFFGACGRALRSVLRPFAGRRPAAGVADPQELIVVTVLVAAEGSFKLPKITSAAELRKALSILGSIIADDVLAVEVLWTPDEGDTFTQDELAIDYPLLNTL